MPERFENNLGHDPIDPLKVTMGGYEVGDYRIEVHPDFARESIETEFPEFKIESLKPLSEGMGNVVFLVNGDYIFRFPKHEKANRTLEMELVMVPKLHSYLSIPVPDFRYVGMQPRKNSQFVGYKRILGQQLKKELLEDHPGRPSPRLTGQIATFLSELHSFDLKEARNSGVPERNLKLFFAGQRIDAREHVYPLLRKRLPKDAELMITKIERAFEDYLTDDTNFEYDPKLLHGDLEKEHILFDSRTRNVTGIIDFGGLQISDPDYDLWRPYYHYGRGFINELLARYKHANSESLYRKIEFFWTAQLVHRLLRSILLQDEAVIRLFALPRLKERLTYELGFKSLIREILNPGY